MEVVNPNYVHEREAGEEIILNRAADNFFTLRKPSVQKKEEAQLKAFEKKISQKRSFDRDGVLLSDGQIAGYFVRSGRYQCRKGSKNGPGESIYSMPYNVGQTIRNTSHFQSRPSTSFQNSNPGPAAYEIHRLENSDGQFSFSRSKRRAHDGSELCTSMSYCKKQKLPLQKVSTAKDFVDMTAVRSKEGFPFSKLDRGLNQYSSPLGSGLGPGHYHNCDKAYKSFYDSSEKYSFARDHGTYFTGSGRNSQRLDLGESLRNPDLTEYSNNFQRFSDLDRFELTQTNSKQSIQQKVKFSSNKLLLTRYKKRRESQGQCIQRNRESVGSHSPEAAHYSRLQQITRHNLKMNIARRTSQSIEKRRVESMKEKRIGKVIRYNEEKRNQTQKLQKEWLHLVAVGALGNAIGKYFLSRYHTRKKSLKFLGMCYYISRFMGKAKIWLRHTRLRKAAKNFARVYLRPRLARNLRNRKKKVISFLKKLHYSSKLQEASFRLYRTLSNIQRWYRQRIFYNTVLKAVSNYAWWLYQQEIVSSLQGRRKRSYLKDLSIDELMNEQTPLIPVHIRVLFMNAFMRHRRLKFLQAIKFWEVERDYLQKKERKISMQARKFQLSFNKLEEAKAAPSIRIPPRPKMSTFLAKAEICEMINIAWQARDIWKYEKHEPQLIRKIERFISDMKISKIKRRQLLVADSSAEGKKFKKEVELARQQFKRETGKQLFQSEMSSFSSDQESKREIKRRAHSQTIKRKKKKK